MMPNVPLHSMVEPSWIVPRDESLESNLFVLEEQEKEYNASLCDIANIAAPEPIGANSTLPAMGIGIGMADMSARRIATPASRHSARHSRSSRSSSRRVSHGTGPGTGVSTSYGYTPGAVASVRRDLSRSSAIGGDSGELLFPSPIDTRPTPTRASSSGSGIGGRRSFESFGDTDMDRTVGGVGNSFSSEFNH